MLQEKIKKIKGGDKMNENNLVGIIIWIVGVIVALAVGSGMVDGTLNIPIIPPIITTVSGWIVVVGAVVSVVLAILNK